MCTYVWRDVFWTVWRSLGTIEHIKVAASRQIGCARALGPDGRLASVTVVYPAAMSLPDARLRKAMDEAITRTTNIIKVGAVLFEDFGPMGAVLRGVITALRLTHRDPYPTRMFSHRDALSEWLLPHLRRASVRPSTRGDLVEVMGSVLALSAANR
jgi:hypothetical protein